MSAVGVRKYPAPEIDKNEILRYAKTKDGSDIEKTLDALLYEMLPLIDYSVVYSVFDFHEQDKGCRIGELEIDSSFLKNALKGYTRVIVFVASIGAKVDRIVNKYLKISPLRALIAGAIGAERVEALCDAFAMDISAEYGATSGRFSPGYGDLPLELQKNIFELLKPEKHIGLTLTDDFVMSPSKSVSAFIGIKGKEK